MNNIVTKITLSELMERIVKSTNFLVLAPHVGDALTIRDLLKKQTGLKTDKYHYVSVIDDLEDIKDLFVIDYDFICPEIIKLLNEKLKTFKGEIFYI